MIDLSTAPAARELPKKNVRISPNLVIEMGSRENENDGSVFPAITFCKYRKNSYNHEKNSFIGRPTEISFGLRTAQIAIDTILEYLHSIKDKY
jgi:hypothetical protein